MSEIVHHAVLYTACGQSREASSFIIEDLMQNDEKKSKCNISATFTFLFILQSVLIGVVLLI